MIQRAASYILISCGHGNTGYSTPFIGLHQADMEIAETAKTGLRIVQHFMKSLKDEDEPSFLREKRGRDRGSFFGEIIRTTQGYV